jgi:hypothetical protein
MLIALTITSTLLTAALAALDVSFKSYKFTTEGASTHVVTRATMHRLMAMVRTGADFAPYPVDPLDGTQNPVQSDFIEFAGALPPGSALTRIIRVEKRSSDQTYNGAPLFELWVIQQDYSGGTMVEEQEKPLLRNLLDINFTLEYDVGPRLLRATVDVTVQPNDTGGDAIYGSIGAPTIRLVSTISPRRLEEE